MDLDRSIDDFEWSVRSRDCLRNANILTLRDLTSKTEAELLRSKAFGRISLNEIKAVLASMGLHLRDDDDNTSLVARR
jgi:DNA-directed RNA polymerase subunit alpha